MSKMRIVKAGFTAPSPHQDHRHFEIWERKWFRWTHINNRDTRVEAEQLVALKGGELEGGFEILTQFNI